MSNNPNPDMKSISPGGLGSQPILPNLPGMGPGGMPGYMSGLDAEAFNYSYYQVLNSPSF